MKTNLTLHCGASECSFEKLAKTATPKATETWFPICHAALVEQVRCGLANVGLGVVQEAHSLTKGGDRYFGLLQVTRPGCDRTDYSYILGLRNSHDKQFPAGLVLGSQVFVCDNLAFNGEIKIARRHTKNIIDDLPTLVGGAVGLLNQRWNRMNDRIDKYKGTEFSNARAHDAVIRALDAGACTTTQIPQILSQWRTPNHPEFQPRTAWSLFNAFTEVAKGGSLVALPNRTTRLHALMDTECGLNFKDEIAGVTDAEIEVANN